MHGKQKHYCSPARTFPVPWTGNAGWHIFGNQPAVCCGVCGGFRSCDSITGQSLSDYKKQGWHRVCVTGARGLASRENGANVFAPSWTYFGSCSEPSFRDADADAECHSATHHLAAVTLYGFFLPCCAAVLFWPLPGSLVLRLFRNFVCDGGSGLRT
jgi:hypothetical protein